MNYNENDESDVIVYDEYVDWRNLCFNELTAQEIDDMYARFTHDERDHNIHVQEYKSP